MNEGVNNYIQMLHRIYATGTNNHPEHNTNPDYWDVLLGDVKSNPEKWKGKTALDFGVGQGRNVTNMFSLAQWGRIDGVDVSDANVQFCKHTYNNQSSVFYKNRPWDLKPRSRDF